MAASLQTQDQSLLPFLLPRGVVVVGVSASTEKLGYGVARNLTASGFTGAIHFVGQRADTVLGRTLYTELSQVPDPVDLAVLVIPAAATPATLSDCAARGIHAAIILSAGFREAGTEGAVLEQQCLEVALANGMRLLGPNCVGTIDMHLPLDTSFLHPPMPPEGGIAFLSHSGAFCAAIVDWSRHQGFGFAQIVSLGNQADINETDMLPMVAQDARARVIALYMESVSDGEHFVRIARKVSLDKPIVAMKVGRSESGQRAAASHTAAMTASDSAFDAAFAKCGIFRAASTEEMFDWARALEHCPLPRGRRVAVLTNAGGPGVIAADSIDSHALELAALSESTRDRLSSALPSAASVQNPVDMLASASPWQYATCLEMLIEDTGVDAVLVILPPPPTFAAESIAATLIPLIHSSSKPVLVSLLGSELIKTAFDLFNQAGVPTYPFPERAASALAVLARRAEYLTIAHLTSESIRPFEVSTRTDLNLESLLSTYGIRSAPLLLATSPTEAASIAAEIGFPLVMKIASANIPHKSDVGGVLLDIKSIRQARSGYTKLVDRVHAWMPDTIIDGVSLQPQFDGGQEVILGAIRDPHFGPLIMFGSGGVEAEALKDVAFALAPLTELEADDLIKRTWAGRRLDGFRNIPPVDKAAVRDALIRLSWLADDHGEISELEINPLRVFGRGAIALDVRVKR